MNNTPKQALIDNFISVYKKQQNSDHVLYTSLDTEQIEFFQRAGLSSFKDNDGNIQIGGIDKLIDKHYSPEDFTKEEQAEIKSARMKKFLALGVTALGATAMVATLATALVNPNTNRAAYDVVQSGMNYLKDLAGGGNNMGIGLLAGVPILSMFSTMSYANQNKHEKHLKAEKTLEKYLETVPYGNDLSNHNSTGLFRQDNLLSNLEKNTSNTNENILEPAQKADRSMIDFSIQSIQERLAAFTEQQDQIDHAETKTLKFS